MLIKRILIRDTQLLVKGGKEVDLKVKVREKMVTTVGLEGCSDIMAKISLLKCLCILLIVTNDFRVELGSRLRVRPHVIRLT